MNVSTQLKALSVVDLPPVKATDLKPSKAETRLRDIRLNAFDGDPRAQLLLANHLLCGEYGVPFDRGMAVYWLREASISGNPNAHEVLMCLMTDKDEQNISPSETFAIYQRLVAFTRQYAPDASVSARLQKIAEDIQDAGIAPIRHTWDGKPYVVVKTDSHIMLARL